MGMCTKNQKITRLKKLWPGVFHKSEASFSKFYPQNFIHNTTGPFFVWWKVTGDFTQAMWEGKTDVGPGFIFHECIEDQLF